MIRTVIVDDEVKSRQILLKLLSGIDFDIDVVGEAGSVSEGLQVISETQPDLVFMDVEMMDGTGFDLLGKIDSIQFKVIFTTAHDHYATRAFKYSAIDYLLKPVCLDELHEGVCRVEKSINDHETIKAQVDLLLSNFTDKTKSNKVAIKGADRIDFIDVRDIIYCVSESSYTEIVLLNDRKVVATKPLKYYDSILSADFGFFRASRIHLINPDHISSYKKDNDIVVLNKNIEIEISRRRRKDFLDLLGI